MGISINKSNKAFKFLEIKTKNRFTIVLNKLINLLNTKDSLKEQGQINNIFYDSWWLISFIKFVQLNHSNCISTLDLTKTLIFIIQVINMINL